MENAVQRPTTPLVVAKQRSLLSSPGLRARSSSNAGGGSLDPLSKLAGGACAPTPTPRAKTGAINPPASPAPTPLTQRVKGGGGGGGLPPPSPAPTPATKRKGPSAVSRVVVFEDPVVEAPPPVPAAAPVVEKGEMGTQSETAPVVERGETGTQSVAAPVVEMGTQSEAEPEVERGEMGIQSEDMEVITPASPPPRAAGVETGVQSEEGEDSAAVAAVAAEAAAAVAAEAAAAIQGKLEEVTREKEELRERLERDKSHIKVLMQVLERSRDSVHEAWERGRAGMAGQKVVEEGLRGALSQAEARLGEAGREAEALKERMEREKAQMRVVCAVLTRSRETLRDSMEREKDALAGREVELTGAIAESTLAAAQAQREAATAQSAAAHSKALVATLQSSLADVRAEVACGKAREKALLGKVSQMVEELALTRDASRETVEAAAMRASVAGAAAAAGAAVARKREESLLGEIEGLRKGLSGAIAALRHAALERGWVGGGSGSHSPSSFSSSSSSSTTITTSSSSAAGGGGGGVSSTEQPHFAGGGLILCDCGGGVCEIIEAVFGGMASGVDAGVMEAMRGSGGGGGGSATPSTLPPPPTQALAVAAKPAKPSSFAGVFGGKRGGGAPNKEREQAVGSMAAGLTMQLAALHRALADSEARAMAAGHLVARSSQSLEVMRRLLDVYEGFLQRIGEERVIAEARASIAQKGATTTSPSTAIAIRGVEGGDSFPHPSFASSPVSQQQQQQQQQPLALGKSEDMVVVKVPSSIPTSSSAAAAGTSPSSLSPRTASHMFFRPMSPLEMERGGRHTTSPSSSSSSSSSSFNSSSNSPSTIHTYSASSVLHSVNTTLTTIAPALGGTSSSSSSSVASLFAPLRAALTTTVNTLGGGSGGGGGGGGAPSTIATATATAGTAAVLRRALMVAQGNLDELALRMELAMSRESAALAALTAAESSAGAAQSALLTAAHANSRLLAESAELSGYARACEAARGEALRLSSSMAVAVRGAEGALSGLVKAHSVLRAGSRRVVGELRGSLEKQLWSSPDALATGALKDALMGLEECLKASASARAKALKAAEAWGGGEEGGEEASAGNGGGGGGPGKFLEAKAASLASLAAAVEGLTRTFPLHASTATSPGPVTTYTSTAAMTSPLSPGAAFTASTIGSASNIATAEAGVATITPMSMAPFAARQQQQGGGGVDTAISPMVFSPQAAPAAPTPVAAALLSPHTPGGLVSRPSTSTTITAFTTTATTMNFTQFMCSNESLLLMQAAPAPPPSINSSTTAGSTTTSINSPFLAAFPAQSPATPYLFSSPPQTTPMAMASSPSAYYPASAISNASWPTALSRGSTASRLSSQSSRRGGGRASRGDGEGGGEGGGGGGGGGAGSTPASLLLLTPMDPALALSPTELGEDGVGMGMGIGMGLGESSMSSTIRGGGLGDDAGLGWTLAAIASIQASADIGSAALMEAVEGFGGGGATIGDGGVESCVDVEVKEEGEAMAGEVGVEEIGTEERDREREEEENMEVERAQLLSLALEAVAATSTMAKNAIITQSAPPLSPSSPLREPEVASPLREPEMASPLPEVASPLREREVDVGEAGEIPAPSSPTPSVQIKIGGIVREVEVEEVVVAEVEEVEAAPAAAEVEAAPAAAPSSPVQTSPSNFSSATTTTTAAAATTTTFASVSTTNDTAAIADFAGSASAASSSSASSSSSISTSAVARAAGKPPTIPHSRAPLAAASLSVPRETPTTPPPNLDLYVFEGPVLPEGGSHTNSFASTQDDDLESVASYASSRGSTSSSMSVSESVARGSVRASLLIRGFRGKRRGGEKEKEKEGSTRNSRAHSLSSSSSDISNISFTGVGGSGGGVVAPGNGGGGGGGGSASDAPSRAVEDAAPPPCVCRHGAGEPPCTGCGKRIRLPPSAASTTTITSSSSLFSKIAGSLMRKSTPQHRHCGSCGGIFCTNCTEGAQAPHAILGAKPSLASALDAKGLKVACASCCGSKLLSGDLEDEAAEMLQAMLMGLPLPS